MRYALTATTSTTAFHRLKFNGSGIKSKFKSIDWNHSMQTMESNEIRVSDAAIVRIANILASEQEKDALRISVEGGGCSGFSYQYQLVAGDRQNDDLVIERDGARILIDSMSIEYMRGSVVDFVDDLIGQSFQVKNPNAVASCGCGTSFTI